MSSIVRRSLGATAAVAGITAAGVGLPGPALAAPPDRPGAAAPAPDAGSTPNIVGDLGRPAPNAADLPQLFTVENTGVHTAERAHPSLPTPDQPPSASDAVDVDTQQVRNTDVDFRAAAPKERDSAMQELDAASMFGDLPGQLLGATESNDLRA
jgi:hypothetical protein